MQKILGVPAPRVGQPIESIQLVVSQLQGFTPDISGLSLQGNKPWPLFQHLQLQ
jgi:hypothetical protein